MPADTPEKKSFSQHANILAVLTDAIDSAQAGDLIERTLKDKSLVQASLYFQHYLHQAIKKVGAGDRYLESLQPWRDMLALGLTTWAEIPDPARSDCHAWSAHPNFHLLNLVAGIESAAPGFEEVEIRPHLGRLKWIEARMPHPRGEIAVKLNREGRRGLQATVSLPAGVTGRFIWRGQAKDLTGGDQRLGFE